MKNNGPKIEPWGTKSNKPSVGLAMLYSGINLTVGLNYKTNGNNYMQLNVYVKLQNNAVVGSYILKVISDICELVAEIVKINLFQIYYLIWYSDIWSFF